MHLMPPTESHKTLINNILGNVIDAYFKNNPIVPNFLLRKISKSLCVQHVKCGPIFELKL